MAERDHLIELRKRYPEVYRLLDKLRTDLTMAEFECKQDIDRLVAYYRDEAGAKRRYTRMHNETADLRAHIDCIIGKIADVEATRPPPPFVMPAGVLAGIDPAKVFADVKLPADRDARRAALREKK